MQEATVLQLFPYRWDLPDGSVIRERYYFGMVLARDMSYFRWVNPHAENAYFRRFVTSLTCFSQIPALHQVYLVLSCGCKSLQGSLEPTRALAGASQCDLPRAAQGLGTPRLLGLPGAKQCQRGKTAGSI